MIQGSQEVKVDKTFSNTASVLYDAVFVAGGKDSIDMLKKNGKALHFINEAFSHNKPIGAVAEGVELINASFLGQLLDLSRAAESGLESKGVVISGYWNDAFVQRFRNAIAHHRFWNREVKEMVPA